MADWNNSSGDANAWNAGGGSKPEASWWNENGADTNGASGTNGANGANGANFADAIGVNNGFGDTFTTNGNEGLGDGFSSTGNNNGENDGDNRGCFNCGEAGHNRSECPKPVTCNGCGNEGHMRKDCPERPVHKGPVKCYNCGEEGHFSSDCPQPSVCKECGSEDHTSKDCPNRVCKNCGHTISQCEAARKVDRDMYPDVSTEKAWLMIQEAVSERDIDDLKHAVQCYVKASPEITYADLENAFRSQQVGAYLVAMEKPNLIITLTNMDLQGNLDKKYTVNYRFDPRPARPRERELWPASPEENLERLVDAGEVVSRGIPKCQNCDELGHLSRACPQEKQESEATKSIKCYNCDQEGHRVRDCPVPRTSKFACRNCGKEGHKVAECPEPPNLDNVECRKCGEMGHFSRDCPQGGGSRACRNCGQEGHIAKECTEPRNMDLVQCRNCDEHGHTSRDCPKPRDMTRIVCSNCQEKGHFKSRCPNPIKEEDAGGFEAGAGFDAPAPGSGGFDTGGDFGNSDFGNNAGATAEIGSAW